MKSILQLLFGLFCLAWGLLGGLHLGLIVCFANGVANIINSFSLDFTTGIGSFFIGLFLVCVSPIVSILASFIFCIPGFLICLFSLP